MARNRGSYHVDFSSSPVNPWIVLRQPRVSQNDVVPFSKVSYEEVLYHISSINSEVKFDLVTYHSSGIAGSIDISGVHWPVKFLQRPLHPLGEVEVDATDCCPTVD